MVAGGDVERMGGLMSGAAGGEGGVVVKNKRGCVTEAGTFALRHRPSLL